MENGIKRAGIFLSILLICILQFSNTFAQPCVGDANSLVLDDDFDGYSNGDETLNGTDKCSSLSVPFDFDEDYTSDMLDADDDNDGLSDIADKFALDKQNGTTTNIPVYYRFQNPNNGGIGNSGFTGLMNTGATNYANLYTAADLVIGGPTSKFIVNNIPVGDALAASNSQKNGFQFGVNAGAFPFNYTISSRLMTPFAAIIPADFQSMGMFMGTGDQDNYLKIACASNGGVGGIEVVKEVAGVVTSTMYSAPILGSSQVNFYFTVNRAANTVQPSYSKNGGAMVNVGSAIAVPSSWLSNVLAVGIISTSRGATTFTASWDNIAVQPITGNGQWQTINTTNTCVARHDCGFVQNGSKFFLLGGHETNNNYTEVYNYSSKTWSVGADIRDATPPIPLHHFQAVQIRGMIYFGCAFTSVTPNDMPADNVYFYDPPYNLYHTGIVIPQERRRGAAAAVTYNEKIYFIGGLKGGHNSGWTNYLDVYDPYTSTWTILPDAPHERDHFQAVVHNGKIYCIGGRKTGFGGSTYAETVVQTDVYDIEEQTWTTLPSPECDIPTPRGGASVGLIGDEIFVIGGENMSQTAALNTTEAFNVKTKTWRTVAGMNTGRQGTQAIVNNYAIYIVGGTSSRGESPDLSSMEVFYPYGTTAATGTAFTKGISAQIPSANISFGQVPIGTTSTKPVWLKNTGGTQAMVITKIQIAANSTNFYSVTYPYTPPYTVNPGDSTKIQVTFRPNSAGVINGTLYASNTATNADNTSFGLTGTGVTQQTAVRINCSGPQITASSNVFSEDFFNLSGTTGISTSQPISGTTDDALYQTARSGSAFSYNIPVQNNTYTVNLYFAEIASNAVAGINMFDVRIENSTKITALDLFTTAGLYTAYTRTFTIPVTDQMMNLDFIANAGNARVSAIELIPAAVTQGILTSVPMPVEFPVTDLSANSAPITVTLTNTGTASLNITSVNITGTNAANFVQTYGINPTTLPPGSTKTFTVSFLPNSSGLKTATLNVVNTGMNTTLSIPLKGTGSSTSEPCGHFLEQNGLLVMEVESQKPTESWTPNTAFPNYTGTEYYTWQGANNLFEKGHGEMRYEFKITNPGKYRFRLRSRHPGPDPTHFNDIWVRFPDHGCTFEKNGQLMEEPGTGYWILSMATADAWTYNSFGRRRTYWEIYVEFKDPGVYYVDLAGRVEYFSIDRMVLYKMDQYTEWQACGSNPPQSPWEDCPQTPYTWYRDKDLDDYGDPNVTVQAFSKPGPGWIWNNQDCDDNQKTCYPGAPEILDGRDNDCNGIIDDGALLDALNINCGGSIYTDVNGDVFESDRLYKPSNTSTKFFNNMGDILNTDDDALFKSERLNSQNTTSFTYNLKAAPGKFYKVSLYFAEQGTVVNPGERVFNVSVEDSIVLNNFDIISTVGYKTAYVHDAYVYLRDSTLNIKFTDVVGKAKINAIKAAMQPNIPPTFKLYPVFPAFNEDFTGTKTITLTPDSVLAHEAYQTVTYSLSPATCSFANISINPVTGLVTYTALPNGNGVQVFTVIANDGQAENNIATKTFQLKVLAVNDKPIFTMSGNMNVNKNFLGNIDVTAIPAAVPADEQNQVVTYSLSPASIPFANVSINSATGTVSFTSINSQFGTQTFTVTANDGMASNSTYTQTFTFTVNNINYPPTLDAIADLTIDEDAGMQTVNMTGITAGLGEIQAMTMTAISDNALLIPNPSVNYSNPDVTGSLSFVPVADKSGIAHITVTLNDGSLSTSKTFTVNVNAVNDVPAFVLSGNAVTVDEDFAFAQQLTVFAGSIPADEMSQVVTYSLSPASVSFADVSINSSTGMVTITSIANQNGSQLITVIANDGQSQNNISTQTFMLTVNSVNDAPAFTLSGDMSVNEDFAGTQTVSITPSTVPADEASQVVTYSLSPASVSFASVSINSSTGAVSIIAMPDLSGSQMFTVTANDGQAINNTSSKTFMLTINAVNDAPLMDAIADMTINEDAGMQTVSLSGINAGPLESQALSVSAVSDNVSLIANPPVNYSSPNAIGSLSLAPVANKSGVAHIIVTVSDGSLSLDRMFTVTVNSINDAPVFAMSGDVTVNEDFAAQHVTVAPGFIPADEMSQVVSYSLSPVSVSFANVSINSSTGEVTIISIADASGSQMFTVMGNDGQSQNNTYSQTFTLTVNSVNDAPAFTTSGDVSVNEDFAITQHVMVTPVTVPADEMSQVVAYSLSPASVSFANVSINSATGEVEITSVPNANGSQMFTVTANDGQSMNNLSSQTFVLTVNSVNDAPAFTLSGDVTVNEDFAVAQHVSVSPMSVPADEVAQVVSYSLSPASVLFANVSINSMTGEVTITSVANASGSQMFTVTANDGQSQNNLSSQTFMLTVNSVNDAPAFALSGDVSVNEDFASAQTVSVTPMSIPADEMSQVVSYSLSPASVSFANVSINSMTGEVTITSIADASGSQMFTVTSDDGQSMNNLSSQTFMLTVNSVNDAPAFTLNGDVTVSEDFATAYNVMVTPAAVPADEMSQTVSYSLSPSSVSFANVSINSTTGEVTITSIADASGSQMFTVLADDGQSQNNTYSQTFMLTVNSMNDAPAFTLSGDVSVSEDFATAQHVMITPVAVPADEMSQVVSYNLSPASVPFASVSINSATGEVTITSIANASGTQMFTVTANDEQSQNNISSQTFMLNINSVNDAPAFTLSGDVSVSEDFTTSQHVTVSPMSIPADELGQVVTYSLSPSSVSFADISFNSATGEIVILPLADANGSQLFTITADDGQAQDNASSASFTLNVNSVNDAPAFTLSGDITVIEGLYTSATETVTPGFVPTDEMSQSVVYSLLPASISFATVSINNATGEVAITPIADQFGSQVFTITANDGQSQNSMYSQTFMLTVEEGNNPPSFALSGDVNVGEDFSTQYVVVTPDPVRPHEAGQVVTYSLSPASVSFANISFDSNTGNVTITSIADLYGSQQFTITADDHQSRHNIYSQTFMLTVNSVNDVPSFTTSGNVMADEDFSTTEHVHVTQGFVPADEMSQVVTYSLSPSSVSFANISFNSATGEVAITAIADEYGSQLFTLTADDGQLQNNIYSQNFTLTVNSMNDVPSFTTSGSITVSEDFATAQHVTVTPGFVPANEMNQVVAYSLSPASVSFANVSINTTTGEVTITAIADASGSQLFTITSDDGQSQNNTSSQTFMLNVNSVNDAPAFTLSGDILVNEDFAVVQHVSVSAAAVPSDELGHIVSYSLLPSSVSFANVSINSSTGEVTITSIADANGSQMFTITADDGQGVNNLYSQTFMLTVNSVNDAPIFTLSGDVVEAEDFAGTRTVSLSAGIIPVDEAGQVVSYSLSPSSVSFANVSINSLTGEVSITSVADVYGSQMFTVMADDGQPMNSNHLATFTLVVNSINDQPTLDLISNVTVLEDAGVSSVNLSGITSGGGENQTLMVTAVSDNPSLLALLSINYTSPATLGTISFQLASNMSGSATITVTVNDGQILDNTMSRSFVITVTSDNDAPEFSLSSSNLTLNEDFIGTQSVSVIPSSVPADEMSQAVTYSLLPSSVSFANVSINSVTGEVMVTSIANVSGSQIFTVTADDGQSQNGTHSETFVLTVNPVNDAPVFNTNNSIINVVKNFTSTESIVVIPASVPADEVVQAVTYALNPTAVSFANISFNALTGDVSITSKKDMTGTQIFTITADDGQFVNNLHSKQFVLTVIDTNYQPTLDAIINPAAIDEDAGMQTVHLTGITAGFNESQGVTVTAVSDNPSLIPNPAVAYNNPDDMGTLSYAPVANQSGVAVITVTVDDGQIINNFISRSFTIRVNPVNDEPALDAISDQTIMEDATMQTITMTGILAGPIEAQTLSVTAVSSNPSLIANPVVSYNSPDATGTLSYIPATNQNGSAIITVTVNDGQANDNITSKTFMVTVNPVDDLPVLSNIQKNGQEDKNLGFQASNFTSHLSDIEGDTLTKINIISLPVNGTLLLNGNAVSAMTEISKNDINGLVYDPANEFAAVDSFLWNGHAGTAYALSNAKVYLNINQVNDKPYVTSHIQDINVSEDALAMLNYVDLDNIFTDIEDAGNMTYTITMNSNIGMVNVTVDTDHTLDISFVENANGSATIAIQALDNGGAMIADTFSVTVNSVEDVPSAFNLLTPVDGSLISNLSAIDFSWETSTDGDGDAVIYSVVIQGYGLDTTLTGVSVASMLFNGEALFTADSTYRWYVIASDGDDSKMSEMFSFKTSVTAVHDPYTMVSSVEAYPNPFSTKMLIGYELKADAKVTLRILNFLGQEVMTLANEQQLKGHHEAEWNGYEAVSGVYFYELLMESKGGMEGSFIGKVIKD